MNFENVRGIGPAEIGGLICGFLVIALVGAVILRAAIALYNTLSGGRATEGGVPDPSFPAAIAIVVVVYLVNAGASFVVSLFAGGLAQSLEIPPQYTAAFAQLVGLPVALLVMAIMLTVMLPTTFLRALLVTLLYFLIAIVISVILGVIMFFITLGTGVALKR